MRHESKALRLGTLLHRLMDLGFTLEESNTLRRAQLTLHRWDEQECGDGNAYASWAIERDEVTGKPFRATYPHNGKSYRRAIPDREAGAMRRVLKIVKARNERFEGRNGCPDDVLLVYHQSDCRGCSLYLVKSSDIPAGSTIDTVYNRGLAVVV